MGAPANCLPVSESTIQKYPTLLICGQSGTALGATWDVALIEEVGLKILAEEAKLRSVSSMNGPTCNIQRVSLLCYCRALLYSNVLKQEPIGRPSESNFKVDGPLLTRTQI